MIPNLPPEVKPSSCGQSVKSLHLNVIIMGWIPQEFGFYETEESGSAF